MPFPRDFARLPFEQQTRILLENRSEISKEVFNRTWAKVKENHEIKRAEYFQTIPLKGYVKEFWSVLEPTNTFIDGWEVGALTEHLTACYNREIRNLLINISPRSLKSTICSVDFPTWVWTQNPSQRFITTSYAQNLALRDATKARTLIGSPLYQQHYGKKFTLKGEQSAKEYYENSATGFRSSFGVGSSIVGQGGDILICDDPNNPKKNEDAADRSTVNFWIREQWYSRVNDPKTCVRIIIQQRTHENDATGYVLAEEFGFELLKIPFRYEGKKYFTSIGWSDPRTEIGELMNPERFSETEAKQWEKVLGTAASGQLQQEPAPKEGGMFNPSAIKENYITEEQLPNNLYLVRYWDKAFTEGGGAFTAGVLIGKDFKTLNWYVLDVVRGQWEPTFRDKMILQTAERDKTKFKGRVKIRLEEEPGSAGRDSIRILINSVLVGYPVKADKATGDKTVRAEGFSSQWGAGNVYLLRGDWNTDYVNELSLFPNGKFKDQVDASSGGFNDIAKLRVV